MLAINSRDFYLLKSVQLASSSLFIYLINIFSVSANIIQINRGYLRYEQSD